jgi:Acyl-CoA carboxylase epsilon subunit
VTPPETGAGEPDGAAQPIELRVVAGRPTDEELAAVTAVLSAAVQEQAARDEPQELPNGRHWQRADGFLRAPVVPGPGAWRSF